MFEDQWAYGGVYVLGLSAFEQTAHLLRPPANRTLHEHARDHVEVGFTAIGVPVDSGDYVAG